ncbi:hypothetical protein, partial [Pseudomonas sp. ICBG1301]|uniref:hypothetical protein n=1 Tax=Pseudomonas sp. ICBG1301 TaxID=2795987 RepID=UPI001965D2E5
LAKMSAATSSNDRNSCCSRPLQTALQETHSTNEKASCKNERSDLKQRPQFLLLSPITNSFARDSLHKRKSLLQK